MAFIRSGQRPAPVRDRLLDLLRQEHRDEGVTTAELAARMGRSSVTVNAALSRMRMYGYVWKLAENNGHQPCELNRWKLRERR